MAMGVSLEEFIETYNDNLKNNATGKVDFEPIEHYRILANMKKLSTDEKEIKLKIEEILKNMDKYLKPGALELLKLFKEKNDELFLLTGGNIEWQEAKVKGAKSLEPFFDKSHQKFAGKEKIESMDFLKNKGMDGEAILIINDNLKEGQKMKKFLDEIGKKSQLLIIEGDYSEETEEKEKEPIEYEKFQDIKGLIKKYFPDFYKEQLAEEKHHLK